MPYDLILIYWSLIIVDYSTQATTVLAGFLFEYGSAKSTCKIMTSTFIRNDVTFRNSVVFSTYNIDIGNRWGN